MDDDRYKNREIDEKLKERDGKQAHFEKDVRESLSRVEVKMDVEFREMERRQNYTNGKVKKVIIALVAVAAFAVGNGLANGSSLIELLKLLGI